MRHTFATLALAASGDIYWVSKQPGHESIRTTLKHYARFVPAVDDRNMRLLDDFAAQRLRKGAVSRAFHDGASRTRTGDLLGAIQSPLSARTHLFAAHFW
jgi:hypothetical protein